MINLCGNADLADLREKSHSQKPLQAPHDGFFFRHYSVNDKYVAVQDKQTHVSCEVEVIYMYCRYLVLCPIFRVLNASTAACSIKKMCSVLKFMFECVDADWIERYYLSMMTIERGLIRGIGSRNLFRLYLVQNAFDFGSPLLQ